VAAGVDDERCPLRRGADKRENVVRPGSDEEVSPWVAVVRRAQAATAVADATPEPAPVFRDRRARNLAELQEDRFGGHAPAEEQRRDAAPQLLHLLRRSVADPR
jgi:hypothetical protein